MARKRRIGDRNDGYRLRTLDPLYNFIPYIMARRSDAWTLFEDQVEITEVDRWLRNTRKNGYKGLGYLHLFIASYVRVVSQRPTVNRFVVGRRIYARNNIEIVMAVRRGMSSEAGETTIKVVFEPTDTVFDVYKKMEAAIGEIKNGEEDNGTEAFARIATKLPRFLLQFAIGLLKLMDYFGLIPASLLAVSPFHGSMIITDLGSLGIGPVYHHIYDFGTLPAFIAFGAKRKVTELEKDGTPVQRKYIDYKINTDERICDGYDYAMAFKYFKKYLRHPEELETPPEKVYYDVD